MDKVEVNGENTAAVYTYMKEALPGILGSKKKMELYEIPLIKMVKP